ncbi:TIR domain-containing protein [Methylorubrum extorquens]|uniref:WD-40 repeat protein n=1 Tax=Methylorubrum extorquens (strain CM4 / NCIMB 13688) TaxID=440085 RepID=B7L3I7_METC4|nr:TIR domain-containing protein [Methylorubrum extorquens]ACK86395.1 WD-40 repeat protein [Methylorubrum extorquens CM4]
MDGAKERIGIVRTILSPGRSPNVALSAFDAFLSYSTALDGRLAPALQSGIERYAKPWHKLRACRVFRDTTNLNVSPDLWQAIEVALDRAPRLILLASPEAAGSKWVRKEVQHWLSRHDPSSLFLVLTGGEIAWDDEAADFDWERTDALPPTLAGVFQREPLFVDMRWARDPAVDLSLTNPLFAQAVLSLASPIRGMPMDELGGEAVRQFRATRRLATAAVAVVVCLGIAAAVAAWTAAREGGRANERAEEALRRESLRLAAASRSETASGNATDGLTLALAALPQTFEKQGWLSWATAPAPRPVVPDALGALSEAMSLQREYRVHAPLPGASDGRYMGSGFLDGGAKLFGFTRGGRLLIWSTLDGTVLLDLQSPSRQPKEFLLNETGTEAVVADEGGQITFWQPGLPTPPTTLPLTTPSREGWQDRLFVIWSQSAPRLLLARPDENLTLFELPSGRSLAILPRKGEDVFTISSSTDQASALLLLRVGGKTERYDAIDGRRREDVRSDVPDADFVRRSRDGDILIYGDSLKSAIVATRLPEGGYQTRGVIELAPRDQLRLSPDGRWAARVQPDGTVRMSNPLSRVREAWLSAGDQVAAAEFDSTGTRFVARLENGAIALFAAGPHGWVDGYLAAPGPGYDGLIDPDGRSITMGTIKVADRGLGGEVVTWDRLTGEVRRRRKTGRWPLRVRRTRTGAALAAVLTNGGLRVWLDEATEPSWTGEVASGEADFIDLAFVGDERLLAATRSGTIIDFDLRTGRERRRVAFGADDVTSFAASPGGDILVATSPSVGAIRGELDSFERTRRSLVGADKGVRRAAVSASAILVADREAIQAFDLGTGRLLRSWAVPGESINSLAFNDDGTRFAASTESGTVYVMDWHDSTRDLVLRTGNVRIYSATFAPDDAGILTTGHDGRARFWQTRRTPEELVASARGRVWRCMPRDRALKFGAADLITSSVGTGCASVERRRAPELD